MKDKERFSFFDVGVIIVFVPTIIYLFVYMYELGYLMTFDIPKEFISVDIKYIVGIITPNSIKILIILTTWGWITSMIHKKDLENPFVYYVFKQLRIPALVVVLSLFSYELNQLLVTAGIAFAMIMITTFVFPIVTQRKVKGYGKKLGEQYKLDCENFSLSIKSFYLEKIGRQNIEFIVYICFIAVVMLQMGRNDALTEKSYLTYRDNVVIRVYEEQIILCEFDKKTETIQTDKFRTVILGNADTYLFEHIVFDDVQIE